MNINNLRVGFIGSAGTGKTTTANILSELTGLRLITEGSRIISKKMGFQKPEEIPNDKRIIFQQELFNRQLIEEESDGFIADRTVIDILCYALFYLSKKYPKKCEELYFQTILKTHTYSHIFFFPYGHFKVKDDGVRTANEIYQKTISNLLYGTALKIIKEINPSLVFHEIQSKTKTGRINEILQVLFKKQNYVFVPIKKIKENAIIPDKAHETDTGYDLYSTEDYLIRPMQMVHVSTGICLQSPEKYAWQVRMRSGLAFKHGLSLANGVGTIDNEYTGEIKVAIINFGNKEYRIKKGDRVAQLISENKPNNNFLFHETKNLEETNRGNNGFGSSGK